MTPLRALQLIHNSLCHCLNNGCKCDQCELHRSILKIVDAGMAGKDAPHCAYTPECRVGAVGGDKCGYNQSQTLP